MQNNLNYTAHDWIENLNSLSHDFLNSTLQHSIPIINSFTNNNFSTESFNLINYYKFNDSDSIKIICELPGVPKKKCTVNYKNKLLIISGKTEFNCNMIHNNENNQNNEYNNLWTFAKNKKYYREINIGNIKKENIKVNYNEGCLYILINKENTLDKESKIEID